MGEDVAWERQGTVKFRSQRSKEARECKDSVSAALLLGDKSPSLTTQTGVPSDSCPRCECPRRYRAPFASHPRPPAEPPSLRSRCRNDRCSAGRGWGATRCASG